MRKIGKIKDGNFVPYANMGGGGSTGTYFVGTASEMQQKLAAGELADGTSVYLTDGGKTPVLSDAKIYFEEATDRSNIQSGESFKQLFGKVAKWFSDIDELTNDYAAMKREQMAPYGYFGIEWDIDELMTLVRTSKWDKFAIGDYFIETTSANEKIMWEVAGKNPYLHCGDAELTTPHIVCCPRDCLETYYRYNTTDANAGGYSASLMPANLETEANKFSSKLQSYMTTIRRLENNKGTWAWASRRIFLPGNPELVGFPGWADIWGGGAFNQLPLFVGGNAHLLKGAGFNKSKAARMWYWTADPSGAHTTYFCSFNSDGGSGGHYASADGCVAPLIVLS